ncbi:MAG TPA: hypothetical protein VLM82_04220, partial [Acidobacteriota bacterium]|nr:hypothetical protein [Acidobacteriota bacterium]
GVQGDYVDYMMGHTIDVYHDIQMKGIEYLRRVYAASGLCITPKTQTSKNRCTKRNHKGIGSKPRRAPHKRSHDYTTPNYNRPARTGKQTNKAPMQRIKDRNEKGIKTDMTYLINSRCPKTRGPATYRKK